MIEALGLRSIFIVPALLNVVLLVVLFALPRRAGSTSRATDPTADPARAIEGTIASTTTSRLLAERDSASTDRAKTFLRMAWFANPFAYLTINTVVAISPALAKALSLSPRYAGYFCSVWMFMRTGAFVLLWLWPGWHYRFRWLLVSYLGMMATFAAILLAPTVTGLVLAQLGFGLCIGLIYYSSLYYSMDAGETKGEHGGIHEAAIGLGCAAGPAVGATVLQLAPRLEHGTAMAVGALLFLGLGGLLWLRRRSHGDHAR
jgi:predicted MFS family arabinose efflux permease